MSLRPAHSVQLDLAREPDQAYATAIIEQDRADTRADLIEKVKAALIGPLGRWETIGDLIELQVDAIDKLLTEVPE